MPFVVGFSLIGIGAIFGVWGGISGRLAKMLSAIFTPNAASLTSTPVAGTQQLDLGFTSGQPI